MIAKILKKQRIKMKLTQIQLSNELKYTTAQFISNWERGLSEPPLKDAKKVCHLLGIKEKDYKKILINKYKSKIEEAFK